MSQTSSLLESYKSIDSITKQTIIEFQKSIHKNRFYNNKKYLLDSSTIVSFNKKQWHLRPEYFAYDFYGIPELFRIVLMANDISSRFNFRQNNLPKGIYAPSIESIRDTLTQNIQ